MRVLIATTGPRHEVGPHLGLGVRLADTGHQVVVATHEPFRTWVTGLGLEFQPLPDDPRTSGEGAMRGFKTGIRDLSAGILAAARPGADVILLSDGMIIGGYHVADGLGIPSAGLLAHPGHPTREFPPPDLSAVGSLGPWGNRASARALFPLVGLLLRGVVNDLRAEVGLPPMGIDEVYREQDRRRWPVCYGFSQHVQPRPADWRPGLEVTGYLWPPEQPGWQPPAALAEFLDAGPAPVFVDLGSVKARDAERVGALVERALRGAGRRAVIAEGPVRLPESDQVVTVSQDVPEQWLLPRMAAVVHQASGGITAAALRAGVPAVAIPASLAQPYWAARLTSLGVGLTVPAKKLTETRLTAAISSVVDDSRRDRAGRLAALIAEEDGAGRVADLLSGVAARGSC